MITEQRLALARLLEGAPTTSGSSHRCAPDGASAFWARRRLRGLRLHATDTDWFAGAGAELRGSIGMLLLLLTGRTMTCHTCQGGHADSHRAFRDTCAQADQS